MIANEENKTILNKKMVNRKNRHRIIKKNNYIVISNLKCGFTSLNLLDNIIINPEFTSEDKKILNYRDIFRRNISTFLNWCVDRCDLSSWLMDIMRDILDESKWKSFYTGCKKRYLKHSYRIFLENLDKIYMLNHHTHPQNVIIKEYNIDFIDYFINIDNPHHIKILNILIDDKLPHSDNKTEDKDKLFLIKFLEEEEHYKNILSNIYKDDIEFFKKYNINVNTI